MCRVVDGEVGQCVGYRLGGGSLCRVVDGEVAQCVE